MLAGNLFDGPISVRNGLLLVNILKVKVRERYRKMWILSFFILPLLQ